MKRTNDQWVARLRNVGSVQAEALAELRTLLMSRLRNTFRDRAGMDEAVLEDVTQESLVKTLGSLGQFEGKSQFATWATTIAIRVALTELRRKRWKDVSLDQMLEQSTPVALQDSRSESEPTSEHQRTELVEQLYRVIDTELTSKQRTALLAELAGMPQEEIGRRTGSNRNAVYKLTHDARKRIKSGLEAAGYSIADLQMS